MGKALNYDVVGEFGFCCLCPAVATTRVRLGPERLPVSFCDEHRRQARTFGEVLAVDAWPGRRPAWLPRLQPTAPGAPPRRLAGPAVRVGVGVRYRGIITRPVVARFAAMRRRGMPLARIGRENGVVEVTAPTVAAYLEKFGFDRATGERRV